MNPIELFLQNGKPSGVFYCDKCRAVHRDRDFAVQCCDPKCPKCGKSQKSYSSLCYECWGIKQTADESARFAKAEKLSEWDGPVYCAELRCNDGYFSNLQQLFEDVDPEDLPEYVWACTEQNVINATIGDIIDDLEMAEGQSPDDIVGLEELEKALDAFNKANEGFDFGWLTIAAAFLSRLKK